MKISTPVDHRTVTLIAKISANIRTIRKNRGYTQKDMESFGFGSRWYQRLESGTHMPTIPTLDKLAVAFETEIIEFFR